MATAEQTEAGYFLPEEFLSDDFFTGSDEENPKYNWSFSSNGSHMGPSQPPSPLSTPFTRPGSDALDLIYAAVGHVERLNLNDENPGKIRNSVGSFYTNQELIKQQLQAARISFYHLKRQQLMKMQQQQQQHANAAWQRHRHDRAKAVANAVNSLCSPPSEWPPLQKEQVQQPAAGMTALFLNGGGRRQSNGTGVFLPRRIGAPTEPKRKHNCSTVLLPARVVQALNLNVEDMGVRRPLTSGCFDLDGGNDALMGRSNLKRNHQGLSSEICLPQEWTY